MPTLLIQNAILDGQTVDILIENGTFTRQTETLDAQGLVATPAFYNAHTHAAMTLLRGAADDIPLQEWLQNHIWPLESHMTPDDILIGTRLAILEMIKSGTVFFADMYWHPQRAVQAADDLGVRASIGSLCLGGKTQDQPDIRRECETLLALPHSNRITFAIGPHAIYTVTPNRLKICAKLARDWNIPLHIHLAETRQEVNDCRQNNQGLTPAQHLDACGGLTPQTILAHAIWLEDADRRLIAQRGATLVHCPRSNLKLASGFFDWKAAREANCKLALGTDGAASSNNLDLREEAKFASLLAKGVSQSPQTAPAKEVLEAARTGSAQAYGLKAGRIAPGYAGDCLLWKKEHHSLAADFNLDSNLLYSTGSDCLDTVVCAGRTIMRRRKVAGEEEIVRDALRAARNLMERCSI